MQHSKYKNETIQGFPEFQAHPSHWNSANPWFTNTANKMAFRNLALTLQPQSMENWNSFGTKVNTHGSPFHGESTNGYGITLTAAQTTVMYMQCKQEISNWSKWFDQNPQTSPQLNCCKMNARQQQKNANSQITIPMNASRSKQTHTLQVSGKAKLLFHVSNNQNPTPNSMRS